MDLYLLTLTAGASLRRPERLRIFLNGKGTMSWITIPTKNQVKLNLNLSKKQKNMLIERVLSVANKEMTIIIRRKMTENKIIRAEEVDTTINDQWWLMLFRKKLVNLLKFYLNQFSLKINLNKTLMISWGDQLSK